MRHRLAYYALRVGVGFVGLLPAGAARSLGRLFGTVWYWFDSGRRSMAERHMGRVLGNGDDLAGASKAVMQSYGRYYAEALWARADKVPGMLAGTEVDGLDKVLQARDEGKGMIYALPHMGNWEAAAPIAIAEGVPVVAVAENLPNKRITDWFTAMRGDFGIEIVLATGSIEVMRKLEAALSANKAVALLSDRDLKGKGVEVEFFGETTTIPPGPATLALRTGAPLFPVASYFDGEGHRVVIRDPIDIPTAEKRSEKVRLMSQDLADHLEDLVRDDPTQWHLLQPNWPSDRD